jgi:hypothetical protein
VLHQEGGPADRLHAASNVPAGISAQPQSLPNVSSTAHSAGGSQPEQSKQQSHSEHKILQQQQQQQQQQQVPAAHSTPQMPQMPPLPQAAKLPEIDEPTAEALINSRVQPAGRQGNLRIPMGWLDTPSMGKPIMNFIPMKVFYYS